MLTWGLHLRLGRGRMPGSPFTCVVDMIGRFGMHRRLRILHGIQFILVVCVLILSAGLAVANQPSLAPNPAEMHRIEGEGKASALQHQRGIQSSLTAAEIIDQNGFDADYYSLNIRVDEIALQIYGQVSMRARARTNGFMTPTLNFTNGLTTDSVRSFGRPITWTHASNFLYINLDSSYNTGDGFEVTVYYHGHPPEGGFQGFAFGVHGSNPSVPIISTLSEPYLAQSWWPCKDVPSDKADSTDVRTRVNSSFYCVSNGVLRDSINNGDGTTTYAWHEQYPITTYLVSLAISNYSRFDRWYHYGADSMPVRFYSYPEKLTSALAGWPVAVDQIGFYSATFGEYPFIGEKYGMVHFNWGGAMEHQTVTSATSSSFGFDQYLVCHELSHQWWGDMITCRNWNHIWMNEGFASYCEALWAEHLGGTSGYRNYMSGMKYVSGGRIYIDDTTNVGNIFSSRVYDKGAWVLHMMRGIIGDSAFFATLRAYYDDPRYKWKDVVTEDFRDLAESVSGVNLHDFFNDWIYGYYYPQYMVSTRPQLLPDGSWRLNLHLRQAQATDPQVFHMPVDIKVTGDGLGTIISRVSNTQRDQDYFFDGFTSIPSFVALDPNGWILQVNALTEAYRAHIFTDTLLPGNQYAVYRDSVRGMAAPPLQYVLAAGILPNGITLDPATGVLSGMPLAAGSFPIIIGLYDGTHTYYDQRSYTLKIAPSPLVLGDQHNDGVVDVFDVIHLINEVFTNGPSPSPANLSDVNRDCTLDVQDVLALINFVFLNGTAPQYGCLP
jgi:aminopeptidase N